MRTRVLIVDDDLAFRTSIRQALTELGYEVVGEATTVARARTAISTLAPDALLLDINLPDGNGIAFARELTANAGAPRTLLTSNDANTVTPRLVTRSGAAGFVAKSELLATDLSKYFR
jgi:DNA-binding NarL/FixJ family response regulator